VISTAIASNRGFAMGASSADAGCRFRAAAPVVTPAIHDAQQTAQQTSVYPRIMADLGASSFKGQVWFRPATLDVLVPTTPGHLAWSPPT